MEYLRVLGFTIFILVMKLTASLNCSSNQYESNDTECCSKCKPGFGLVNKCSRDNDTQCEVCIPGETFSSPTLHTETCSVCTKCKSNQSVVTKCNTTHDTVCKCNIDFYLSKESNDCQLCKLCPEGYGALRSCSGYENSVCMKCGKGMFSDKKCSISPCKKCSKCPENEVVIEPCTPVRDTKCGERGITTSHTKEGLKYPTETEDDGFDVIPVYCAILGAVVVGLLGYVMFKHYLRIRNKKRHKGHDPHEEVEYSKTSGGDSGVFVETEHHQLKSYNQLTRIRDLPPNKRREIEKHLAVRRPCGEDWKVLAKELGYTCRKIDRISTRFKDTLSRVQYLLADWSKSRHATVGVFIKVLLDIGRPDIIKMIQCDLGDHHRIENHAHIV